MIQIAARLCAGVVGAVFAVAAASKFLGWARWLEDARQQGVPAKIAALVPPTELVLGVALIATPINAFTLGAATTLLLVFTAFIAVSVFAGRETPCACFGSSSRRAVSWRDVVRNCVLMTLLVVAAAMQ